MTEDMRKKWQPLELHRDSTLDYAISDIYKLEAENKRLREYLRLFIDREIDLHTAKNQPYSCDWNLIKEAQQALAQK